MSELVDFARRVEAALTSAGREPHWAHDEAERYMAEIDDRRRRFLERAAHLSSSIIAPRLEILCGYFPNSSQTKDEQKFGVAYWLGFSERFPASTRIALGVKHDVRVEKLVVSYEARMDPQFIKLNERDRVTLPLDDTSDGAVAAWVEDRLLAFLDAYL